MTSKLNNRLLLEKLLESVSDEHDLFPRDVCYFTRYNEITNSLKQKVYKNVNAGLAANSKRSGLYTDHSEEHFDLVIRFAGIMLGLKTSDDVRNVADLVRSGKWILNAYEIYLLLLSIRFHDVGNIYGRDDHEKLISKVIIDYKIPHLIDDSVENRQVCFIGGAHGGTTSNGSKDTIGSLPDTINSVGSIGGIRSKKIAAITRFADEICENRQRIGILVESGIPEHNLVFHKYAQSIVSNHVEGKILYIRLEVRKSDLLVFYKIYKEVAGVEVEDKVNLPDVIISRLKKLELERRYCNRFLHGDAQIKEISVHIIIVEDTEDEESFHPNVIDEIKFPLKERDYPLGEESIIDTDAKYFMDYNRIVEEYGGRSTDK
ncbi:HD domain-containing protein [Rheinheimera baltica]|uniref:HD domain-containing protein n=1 Tax=Rheinheimera baltica TaxID=67576 RepID=UPI000410E6F7|nr:hypothetical protein [Rheinheimera baltica]